MKKTYSKPEIMFEDFTMSESIALGCEVTTNHALYECQYKYGRGGKFSVFAVEYNCDYTEGVDQDPTTGDYIFKANGLCYHVPTESYNLFTS